ncbi:MAG: prepilin-type N-terminal cleavage/methylation domain-containing protein [bacterium]
MYIVNVQPKHHEGRFQVSGFRQSQRSNAPTLPRSHAPTPPRPHAPRSSGFTLMELLLVIGIIAILAGLLFPALNAASAKAKEAKCMAHVRQWGSAISLYAADNQGVFPGRGPDANNADPAATNGWFNVVAAYMSSEPVSNLNASSRMPRPREKSPFICPQARSEPALSGDKTTYYSSYGINWWLDADSRGCSGSGGSAFTQALRVSQVSKPSVFVVLAEMPTDAAGYGAPCTYIRKMGLPASGDAFRHTGRANLAFADGHAAGFAKSKIYDASIASAYWNFGGIQWNPDNPNVLDCGNGGTLQ